MILEKKENGKKKGINWCEFLAFIVAIYLIITKSLTLTAEIAITLAKLKGGM